MTYPAIHDTVIIGAGPAGLSCALHAAAGGSVLLLEKNPDPGRKLRLSGSGQCNITHGGEIRDFLTRYGEHGAFLKPALLNYSNRQLTAFLASQGLAVVEEPDGKIFPVSRKAADVLSVLLTAIRDAGAKLACGEPVLRVGTERDLFRVTTPARTCLARSLVITTGGKSYPGTGSTGDGYEFARSLGHTIVPPRPALAPVFATGYPFSDLSGISFRNAWLSVFRDGKKAGEQEGDLLLTHRGFSGPGILDFSRSLEPGDTLRIAFLPKSESTGFPEKFTRLVQDSGTKRVRALLAAWPVPDRFIYRILSLCAIPPDMTAAHLPAQARKQIIERMTGFSFTIERLGGFEEAMVTRGGIPLPEVDPKTMSSRLVEGLYFAGEVLDIDGDTGGFNLQAAFSTGVLAGQTIAGKKAGVKKS
ncbi:MAG: NAD(P)/FAD-dependent oxidoreductase [Methanoregulaceae archaeon]